MTEEDASARRWEFDLSNPIGSFASTVRNVLVSPREFFSGIATAGSLKAPLIFAVVCLLVSWLLEGIVGYLVEGDLAIADGSGLGLLQDRQFLEGIALTTILVILSPLGALLRLYIYSGIVHLLVMLFKGQRRRNFEATLRVYCYANAVALLSWIPFIGGIATLYGLYLLVVGLRKVHGGVSEAVSAQG